MKIDGNTVKEHIVEHEILGVKSWVQLDTRYLRLDQTTPQTILNGAPIFDEGLDAGSSLITNVLDPVSPQDAATKRYVDIGVWLLPPIIEWWDPAGGLPEDPTVGDRYGSDGTAEGWAEGYIYEWDGDEWVETEPEEGFMLWDLLGLIFWIFFSGGWMEEGEYSYWSLENNQVGITGNKSGSFDLTTTGRGTFGDLIVDTNVLVVDNVNDRVGIGTTIPTAKIDINSDILRLRTAKTPASATAAGNAGDICWDANYLYIAVATNTWKRAAITTW